jgi:hypothetical protein
LPFFVLFVFFVVQSVVVLGVLGVPWGEMPLTAPLAGP